MTHHKVALVVLASLVLACGGAKPNADGGAGGGQGGGEAGGAGGGTGGGAGGGAGGGGGEIDAGSCTPGDQQVCHNVNSNGSCPGISTCDSNASWSQCAGQVPAKDICDGVDNDCDGTIDNPKFSCTCPGGVQVEICTNQKDDDCDGMIDCPGEPTAVTTYGPSVNGEQPIFCGFGSCNLDNEVDCLAISKSTSGLFIAGGMTGQYDFLGTGNPIGVVDAGTGFLVRLDPLTRAALWQKQLPFVGGVLSFSKTTTFTSPSTGALYVSGAYQHGFSFGGAITGEPDAGDVRLAVLKVSPQTGDPLAGTFFGSPDGGFERQALFGGETADGGLMIAGTFMGSMAQVGGPALPGFGGFGDGFVAELAPGLELRDMRTFGSPGQDSVDSARVNGGKLWVSGRATGAFTFGDAGFGGSGTYGFLFGYDTATHGVPLALSTSAAGEVTSVVPGIGNIAVFAAGYTQGSSTLGGCNVNPNNVNSTLFVAALDAAGGCVWVRTIDNGQVQQASVVLSLSSGNDALTAMGNGGTLGPGFTLPDGGLGNTASTGGATVWYATFVPATGTATSFFHDSNIGSMTPNAAADDFFCGQYGDAYGSTQKFPFSALPQSPSATSSFLTPINR